eukprot:9473649-Pyramimonas_sp.AAC.2
MHIPIEGPQLVGGCGIFPSRGCDWSVDAVYSHRGAVIGWWLAPRSKHVRAARAPKPRNPKTL